MSWIGKNSYRWSKINSIYTEYVFGFYLYYCYPLCNYFLTSSSYRVLLSNIYKHILLTEEASVTKSGGLLSLLLGAKNMYWHPKLVTWIGWQKIGSIRLGNKVE